MARGDYYPDGSEGYNGPPAAAGFARAASALLAQGGGRRNNPRSSKGGLRYTQGPIKGLTQDQGVDKAFALWQNAPDSIKEKYARQAREGMLAPSERMAGNIGRPEYVQLARPQGGAPVATGYSAPIAKGVTSTDTLPPDSPQDRINQAKGALDEEDSNLARMSKNATPQQQAAIAQRQQKMEPVRQQVASAQKAITPVDNSPGAAAGRIAGQAMGAAFNPKPSGAVSALTPTAPVPTGFAASAAIGSPSRASLSQTGKPGGNNEFLGESPPGPGWILVGNYAGQKKWRRDAATQQNEASVVSDNIGRMAAFKDSRAKAATNSANYGNPALAPSNVAPTPTGYAGPKLSYSPGTGFVPKAQPVAENINYGDYDAARTKMPLGTATDSDRGLVREFERQERARRGY